MNPVLKELKERKRLYIDWVYKIDEQIAELEKPKPWEPKGGMWSVTANANFIKTKSFYKSQLFGTERETKELAQQAAVAMRRFNRLLAYRDEFAPGYVFQYGGLNHYIFAQDRLWCVGSSSLNHLPANVYFPENVADELCRKLNSGEVIL